MIRAFQRPETVPLWLEVKDWDGNLVDPTTSIVISVFNPAGTTIVDKVAMTRQSLGLYLYYFQPTILSPLGWWRARAVATDVTKETIVEGGFILQGIAA